ncbi:MAG TPA: Rrf2 family transcriptional regulator [Synechococcales cyanobacterium M55_K2018_004]|nr:Rrf2 family transcriptional regulator [Synechococcales cyanobacterium M55_K2018_004]
MEISSKSEYALLAMIEVASCYGKGEPAQIRQIAAQQNIPDRYLEQLLATLRRGGLLRSERGSKGGYFLTRHPKEITLLDVIVCMEGTVLQKQGTTPSTGHAARDVVLEIWQESQQAANDVLKQYSLQDLLDRLETYENLNLMYYI